MAAALTSALRPLAVFPDALPVGAVPFATLVGPVPFRCLRKSVGRRRLENAGSNKLGGVHGPMTIALDELKIVDRVIKAVTIPVMDFKPLRNRAVVQLVDGSMQI